MTALLIGYAVAITIVFFASRTFSINRPRHTHNVSGENTLPTEHSQRLSFAQTRLSVAKRDPHEVKFPK
jgi:hypothetical protein